MRFARSGCMGGTRHARRMRRQPKRMRQVSKLEIVEHLRNAHTIRGALADFRVDDAECVISFKGPGYAADAFIDRESGHYRLTETYHGFIAVINDLHKGRDTGPVWSVCDRRLGRAHDGRSRLRDWSCCSISSSGGFRA